MRVKCILLILRLKRQKEINVNLTTFYVKGKECDCKFDNANMKDTTLFLAQDFIMLYGCPHTKIGKESN